MATKPSQRTVEYVEFTLDGHTYMIEIRRNPDTGRERISRTTAFVYPNDAQEVAWPDVETEVAMKAFRKAQIQVRRQLLEAGLQSLETNMIGNTDDYFFSEKAGCSCGCSAGFIFPNATRGMTIYISEKGK